MLSNQTNITVASSGHSLEMKGIPYSFIVWRESFVAALGGLLFGFHTAIISGAIPHITSYFQLNGYMLSWAVSFILIGIIYT